ncbi:hypothetical protein S40285_04421 [Stachybotrys chlorohalonatus IBT 40285]|jgi:hypothetical protein|uniref:Nucleosome assembly protein C36B7.08c n=1 Tax=Stachybotrys chlorohalonatus (strain IBT 40285) TaxID=1283841 RepID=A0A084R1V2_STAC4|nr:hypothetical protein S40285_04421 [Stachybotrys chlorohalonata IBT 40285]
MGLHEEAIEIDSRALQELDLLNSSLADIETETMAKKIIQMAPILAQRQHTIDKVPGFWGIVFDSATVELEATITPPDMAIIANSLVRLEVQRPEIPSNASYNDSGLDKFGEPRSITINFYFKENEWFTDNVLSKTFFFRYTKHGGAGLVSDPIKINWKPGKDITKGLTDAAYNLWAAQKQTPSQQLDAVLSKDARKARDAQARELPQFKALAKQLKDREDDSDDEDISFFNFFSYRGRWTSAAEDKEARAETQARRSAALAGKDDEEEEDDDDDEDLVEEAVETFPLGHDIAVTIAEDIWPDAIDYFFAPNIDNDLDIDDDDEDDDVEMD